MAFDPVSEASLYKVRETSVALGITGTLIAPAASNRIALMFSGGSGINAVQYDTTPAVTSGTGFSLASNTTALLRYQDIGPLVGYAWYAISGGGGVTVYVKEVLYVGEH